MKLICVRSLADNMSVDTVVPTFVFADSKELFELKKIAKSFIRK